MEPRDDPIWNAEYWSPENRDILRNQMIALGMGVDHDQRFSRTVYEFPKDFETRLQSAETETMQQIQNNTTNDRIIAAHRPEFLQMVKYLRYCHPLFFGFCCLVENQTEWCSCPCNNRTHRWRAIFLSDHECRKIPVCNYGAIRPGKRPNGLMDHIYKKANQQDLEGKVHWVLKEYMEALFHNYWANKFYHEAFYPIHSPQYRAVKSGKNRAVVRIIEMGKKVLAQKEQEVIEKEEKRKRLDKILKMLENTNADYLNKLKQNSLLEKKIKAILHLGVTEVETITDRSLNISKHVIMSGAGLLKSERRGFAKQPVEVSDLPFQFDLNVLFSDWHARNLVFFTAEKPDGPSLLKGLVVNYQKIFDKAEAAIDEGGPSRQFISEVWSQLGALYVDGNGSNKFFLFGDDSLRDNFLLPQLDNQIAMLPPSSQDAAKAYFRAIGRIFAYCLLHQMPIADCVLPKMFRRYLFKGTGPTDEEYPISELVSHCLEVGESKDSDLTVEAMVSRHLQETPGNPDKSALRDQMEKMAVVNLPPPMRSRVPEGLKRAVDEITDAENLLALSNLDGKQARARRRRLMLPQYKQLWHDWHAGYFILAAAVEDSSDGREEKFRNVLDEMYFADRQVFFSALKEGLRLDGSLADKDIHDLFERVSLERVNRLLFMSNKFESESVVAALAPHYEDEACVGKEVRINQERVLAVRSDGKRTGVLVDVIRQEASKNEDFLRQFVFFVSGHSFFPASSFKMTVEFNSIESADQDQLPEAHTCDNVVKFPGTAYNGDARVLAEKLLLALECTERGGGSFSMQ